MFTVRWKRSARDELATLWTEADSALRRGITTAANQIDYALERDPEGMGESRGGAQRVWFPFPLGVRFEVDHQQRIVRVLHVWRCRRRGE